MMRLAAAYFERLYATDADPWGFASRWYEARKYALTLAALPRERYRRGFEPGCSIGVLTAQLAARCDALVAAELVPAAAAHARARVALQPHVEVHDLAIPEAWPDGSFDLIVLSELGYYLTRPGMAALLARIDGCLATDGHVIAVHWTGETAAPLRGADVHAILDAHPAWQRFAHYTEAQFELAVYERRSDSAC